MIAECLRLSSRRRSPSCNGPEPTRHIAFQLRRREERREICQSRIAGCSSPLAAGPVPVMRQNSRRDAQAGCGRRAGGRKVDDIQKLGGIDDAANQADAVARPPRARPILG